MMTRKLAICIALASLLGACSTTSTAAEQGTPTASATPSAEPTPTPAPSTATTATPAPKYSATISTIGPKLRARMQYSWRRGCPVALKDLRFIKLDHWGFDRREHRGELVAHRDSARAVVRAFGKLWAARFPIHRIVLADAYRANDDRLMAADASSGFNCRRSTGDPTKWSEHSYGRAIDINPVENPYVSRSGKVSPPNGSRYANRSLRARGMIHSGDVVVRAFRSIGWKWGGYWRYSKDYQHFSASGR